MKSYPLAKSRIQDISWCLLREGLHSGQSAEGPVKSALACTAETVRWLHPGGCCNQVPEADAWLRATRLLNVTVLEAGYQLPPGQNHCQHSTAQHQ